MHRITRPGYQNLIDHEDYKLQNNFELNSEFNQLFALIFLFNSFLNTEDARKIDGMCLIVYAH